MEICTASPKLRASTLQVHKEPQSCILVEFDKHIDKIITASFFSSDASVGKLVELRRCIGVSLDMVEGDHVRSLKR